MADRQASGVVADPTVLIVQAAVAYTHRDDLVSYISCQESAHNRKGSCEARRRMVYELLRERLDIDGSELFGALNGPSWCPSCELFDSEDPTCQAQDSRE